MKLLVTGGGTGGHVYPGLAVVEALRAEDREARVVWLGAENGLEADFVPRHDIAFVPVPAAPWTGGPLARGAAALRNARGTLAARRAIGAFRPDVVLATGGWASVPAGLAAASLRVPLVLHEQNAYPGKANRLLARFAKRVLLSFPLADGAPPFAGRTEVTGLPLRGAVGRIPREEARRRLGLSPNDFFLVVFGGSRGARRINLATAGAARRIARIARVLWATGRDLYDETLAALDAEWGGLSREALAAGGVEVVPYIEEMPRVLAAADLAVTRAGAVTTAELAASGLPAILVPYPHAAEAHQEANARILEAEGAAVVIRDEELSAERLVETVAALASDAARREKMSSRARRMHRGDAAGRILAVLREVAA